jgi:hypothetical protein
VRNKSEVWGALLWVRAAFVVALVLTSMALVPGRLGPVGAQEPDEDMQGGADTATASTEAEVTFCVVEGDSRETVTVFETLAVDDEGALLPEWGDESFLGACEDVAEPPAGFVVGLTGEFLPKDGGPFPGGVVDDFDDDDEDGDEQGQGGAM